MSYPYSLSISAPITTLNPPYYLVIQYRCTLLPPAPKPRGHRDRDCTSPSQCICRRGSSWTRCLTNPSLAAFALGVRHISPPPPAANPFYPISFLLLTSCFVSCSCLDACPEKAFVSLAPDILGYHTPNQYVGIAR